MKIRELQIKDAPLMLEWMKDNDITQYLRKDYSNNTLKDCENFIIESCGGYKNSVHLAIVSDSDEYMGTVSLKDINTVDSNAEFAIVIRKKAMRHGYSWFAMKHMLTLAFEKYNLESVYWCVLESDKRAVRFYNKHHFSFLYDVPSLLEKKYANTKGLNWYLVKKNDDYLGTNLTNILGCKVVSIKTIATIDAGQLSFFDDKVDTRFPIKRIYYISKVDEGIRRGFHAHKTLKQILFCPYGEIDMILDNGSERKELVLNNPSVAILIEKPIWREMLWLKKDSILCVACSDYYDENDYIRDYEEYKKYIGAL